MKKLLLLFFVIGLFSVPIGSVEAAPTPLEGFLVLEQGYFGTGDPGWEIMTAAGNGGWFTMDALKIELYDNPSGTPLNYYVDTTGDGPLHFIFDIFQGGNRYQLDLSGNLVSEDPSNYAVAGSLNVTVVPVPTPILLLASGLLGLAGIGRKYRKN